MKAVRILAGVRNVPYEETNNISVFPRGVLSKESLSSTIYSSKFVVRCENRCVELEEGKSEYPTCTVEVERTIVSGSRMLCWCCAVRILRRN